MPDKKSKEETNADKPDVETDPSGVESDDTLVGAEDTPAEDSDIEDALVLEERVAGEDAVSDDDGEADEEVAAASEAGDEESKEPEPLIWDSSETVAETEPASAPVMPPPEPRRSGMGPVLGGLLAAVIGFGGAWYLTSQGYLGGSTKSDPAAEAALVADLEARMAALSEAEQKASAERIASLEAQIAELAGATAVPAEPDARVDDLLAAVSDLGSAVRSQGAALDGLQVEIETIATLPVTGGDGDQTEAMRTLREALASQRKENERIQAEVEKMTADAMAEVEAARAEAETAKAEAEALTVESQKVMQEAAFGAATARLEAALESGAPFDALLPDLEAAGAEIDPVLASVASKGVSTLPALQAAFPGAARDGLAAARKAVVKAKPTDRLTLFVKTHLGARSLEAVDGDSPDAVLSRVGAAVSSGDLSAALTEIAALPQSGQDAMADWIEAAQTRKDASAAAEALIASLNTN